MIKCPKCQFEQPEDVFCANCGVNIQTFKVVKSQKKPAVIALLAVCAVVILWGVIRFSQSVESGMEKTASQENKILDEMNSELDKNKNSQASKTQASPVTAAALPPTMRSVAKPISDSGEKTAESKSVVEAVASGTSPGNSESTGKISNQITMEFALVSKEALEKVQLGVGRVTSNNISKTMLENLNKEAGFKLLSTEAHTLTMGQPTLFSQGTQEPRTKENIGFFIEVSPTRMSDTSADYKISIRSAIPNVSPQGELKVITQSFTEAITLNAAQAFGISGLLPRKQIMENEDTLYKNNILRALLEPGFQKFEEEFVIIINP